MKHPMRRPITLVGVLLLMAGASMLVSAQQAPADLILSNGDPDLHAFDNGVEH